MKKKELTPKDQLIAFAGFYSGIISIIMLGAFVLALALITCFGGSDKWAKLAASTPAVKAGILFLFSWIAPGVIYILAKGYEKSHR